MAEQLILVAKRDCPTCAMIGPVYARLAAGAMPVTVYSQDDPAFPDNIAGVVDDRELEVSYRYDIEIVPTLIRLIDGAEAGRAVGWRRDEWRALTGDDSLGAENVRVYRRRLASLERGHARGARERLGDAAQAYPQCADAPDEGFGL